MSQQIKEDTRPDKEKEFWRKFRKNSKYCRSICFPVKLFLLEKYIDQWVLIFKDSTFKDFLVSKSSGIVCDLKITYPWKRVMQATDSRVLLYAHACVLHFNNTSN